MLKMHQCPAQRRAFELPQARVRWGFGRKLDTAEIFGHPV
jgi:hypothetical protein